MVTGGFQLPLETVNCTSAGKRCGGRETPPRFPPRSSHAYVSASGRRTLCVATPRDFVFIKRADEQAGKEGDQMDEEEEDGESGGGDGKRLPGSSACDVGSVVFGVHQKTPLFIFAPPHPLIWRPPRQPLDAHSPPTVPNPPPCTYRISATKPCLLIIF